MREDVGVGACCGQCVYIYTANLCSRAIKTTEELILVCCGSSEENGDRENMKACFSCRWSLSLPLPSSDVRSRVQVWVRQKENHNLPQPEQPTWTTPSHLSPPHSAVSGVQPEQSSFHNDRQYCDCHRLRDGNMKRSCLSGSGEVTVVSSDVQPSSTWKKTKAFVRFWFLFLSISFLMTMTMISLCRSPIFDG